MAKSRKVPSIADKPSSFCPGCGHGIVIRLISECLEELDQDNNIIFGIGVGCSSLLGGILETDRLHCLHGRASAVCTGMKRVSPENIVVSYQGDGDAYSIGLAETTSAAYRNENFTVIIVNNTNYGMTGGQMSNTTMPGQKTTTTPYGRDCSITGAPIKFPELIASQFDVAYAARGTVTNPANINKLKGYIKNALDAQIKGEGYSVVEVLSPCPTNWGMTALQAMDRLEEEIIPYYPLGEFKTREVK
ncbi:thiamine pyrophosphate-dependent enzyme [Maledivibacter halophilus]|uniref:2-oxoglutarate ferredoxin oxidoreductase subunit beta n=1 Tax=Maledivibacter halophilus TaxID=36842 RepID=A0A1T5MDN6_9FIRM|nr:thiamine pyrophosphate-dependent enzyme [Maledivibacter halophilus]SKC86346.1 2-oxoglutarate ferredoxin oxidoreductase subunit beta [Maledivibacter halophilus]